MADQKISQLTDGGNAQAADEFVVARSGSNFRIDGASVAAAATSVGTLTSLTVSGATNLATTSAATKIGLGTASPDASYKVTISGNSGTTSPGIFFDDQAASPKNYVLYTNGSKNFVLRNQTDALNIFEATSAGNVAFDTNTLYVDAANNRVGVGTASPGSPLDVIRASTSTTALNEPQIRAINTAAATLNQRVDIAMRWEDGTYNGTGGISMVRESATARSGSLVFSSINSSGDATQAMRLDASGNLGLGVTPSAWGTAKALQVGTYGALSSAGAVGVDTQLSNNAYYDGTNWRYIASQEAFRFQMNRNTCAWFTAPSGTAGNAITFTQAMTLDASGNLCVGRTSTINGARFVSSGSSVAYGTEWADNTFLSQMYFSSAYYMGVLASAGERELRLVANSDDITGKVTFWVGGNGTPTERGRFTPQGYFKASDDGVYRSATATYHEIRSTSVGTRLISMRHANTDPYGIDLNFSAASPDNNTNYFLSCGDSTTVRCYIWSDGDLANHDGVYGTISDERLKQDIVDAGSQWDDLKAVRFRKYRMKTDVANDPNAPYQLGVIAQELEQTSPGLVDEHPDFEEQEVTDEDGNVTTEKVQVGTTKTVKSSILLMKAAVALQEAMARIEALEARLEALEA